MRDFSDLEKRIIDRLIELDDKLSLNVLGNILHRTFATYGEYYIKIESLEKCHIEIESNYFQQIEISGNAIEKIKDIIEGTSRDIFIVVKLLEYLERNDLVFSSGDDNNNSIGPVIVHAEYISSSNFDKEVCSLLYRYSRKKFYSTETLRRFKSNHYLADEEIRHRQLTKQYTNTIKYSAIAICVSLLGVFVAAFVPVTTNTTLKKLPESVTVKIDQTRMSNIDKTLQHIDQTINDKKVQNLKSTEGQLQDLRLSVASLRDEVKEMHKALLKLNNQQKKRDAK